MQKRSYPQSSTPLSALNVSLPSTSASATSEHPESPVVGAEDPQTFSTSASPLAVPISPPTTASDTAQQSDSSAVLPDGLLSPDSGGEFNYDTSGGGWIRNEAFEPLPPAPDPEVADWVGKSMAPMDYLKKYIPTSVIEDLCKFTDLKYCKDTGKSLHLTMQDMHIFFGATFIMSCLGLPRIRMYWEKMLRIPTVSESISRDRYFKIRSHLKIVDDDAVPQEEKENDKFWKVRPLLNAVRNGCLAQARPKSVSIDEQMVPFWGHTSTRQVVRGKPNPVGLKNFVATCPDGLPLDFFLYQGKGDTILPPDRVEFEDLDIGGKVVMRLLSTLHEGTRVYMDRYFTSCHLLDCMHYYAGAEGTGTLMKSRIPTAAKLEEDLAMKRKGRGSICQVVRRDGQLSILKWFDNKPVVMISSCEGLHPVDTARRWSKQEKKYIDVPRPLAVKNYNTNMGGVDFLDRVISYYRILARTRKWTVRTIFHFFDFAAAAGWIEYRRDQEALRTRKRDRLDYMSFRMAIAQNLLNYKPENQEEIEVEPDDPDDPTFLWKKHRQYTAKIPHPPECVRTRNLGHLPVFDETDRRHRCRYPTCRSPKARVFCSDCKVYLCLFKERNCFSLYHRM